MLIPTRMVSNEPYAARRGAARTQRIEHVQVVFCAPDHLIMCNIRFQRMLREIMFGIKCVS